METLKIAVERVGHHDRRRVLRLTGAVSVVLEFDALLDRVWRDGERVSPVIRFPRGWNFEWSTLEFSLREGKELHRLQIEVQSLVGTILTFRLYLGNTLIFEDRDMGATLVVGMQCPLPDYPLPGASPTQKEANLPYPAGEPAEES